MSSSVVESPPRARQVAVDDERLRVTLVDGRRISLPLDWFPRLQAASPAERQNWVLIGRGEGIHWPEADEDLSVAGLLAAKPPQR